jgi:single-strand DNA-binding protein
MAAHDIATTVVGNLTDDPELRFTPSGTAVVAFSVAVNHRTYDRATGQWQDGDPSFVRVTAWRSLAENCAESLQRGTRAIVTGTFREERWDDKDGNARSGWKLTADSVGVELTFQTATAKKVRRAAREEVPPSDEWANASPHRPEPVEAPPT